MRPARSDVLTERAAGATGGAGLAMMTTMMTITTRFRGASG